MREQFIENVFQNYDSQTYEKKELIIILNSIEMDLARWSTRAARSKNVTVYKMPKYTLGECLNFGISKSQYGIVAKFDDDDYYAPHYLTKQVRALKQKGADMVCKRAVFMYFEDIKTLAVHLASMKEKTFINRNRGVKGSTLVFQKKLWERVKFQPISVGEDTAFLKECLNMNYKIFSTDRYNYVCIRRSENQHTWKSSNAKLLSRSEILYINKEYIRALQKVKK